jgi:hypothetical protein
MDHHKKNEAERDRSEYLEALRRAGSEDRLAVALFETEGEGRPLPEWAE